MTVSPTDTCSYDIWKDENENAGMWTVSWEKWEFAKIIFGGRRQDEYHFFAVKRCFSMSDSSVWLNIMKQEAPIHADQKKTSTNDSKT